MQRIEYLSQYWLTYPQIESWTSLSELTTQAQTVITAGRLLSDSYLSSNNCLVPISFASEPILASRQGTQVKATEVLLQGDLIAVEAYWDGQKLEAKKVVLLAPAQASLKTHAEQLGLVNKWNLFLQAVRQYFTMHQFIEMQTPTLVICPGTEPFLDVFSTELKIGSYRQKYYLPTSPELHLKKLLSRGYEKIFEIKPCFRNGEISQHHQPEFYMLEWYRAYESLDKIKADVMALIQFVSQKMNLNISQPEFQRKSMSQLFKEKLNFNLTPQTSLQELLHICQSLNIPVSQGDCWDDLFFKIFLEKIERDLQSEGALFLEKYPPSQAALARLTADGWGDRFEFYWQGIEIANAFCELNDPVLQKRRFLEDLEKKMGSGREPVNLDEDFIYHLQVGMPPSSGIALGLERLFMCLTGVKEIGELKLFPFSYPR